MIVSNTSSLIALAKADVLSLLKVLFAEVRIPSAVHRELLAKSGVEANRLDAALADFITVVTCPKPSIEVEEATKHIRSRGATGYHPRARLRRVVADR